MIHVLMSETEIESKKSRVLKTLRGEIRGGEVVQVIDLFR
jgi:hypothetical protein